MRKTVAIVLPAWNLVGVVRQSLNKIREGIRQFPEYNFVLYITDDYSEDNTSLVIKNWISECELQVFFHQNRENLKLVKTLKEAYRKVLKDSPDYILKTDLDKDFDQTEVIKTLVPYASDDFVGRPMDVVIGSRLINEESYDEYERDRRKEIRGVIESKIGYINEKLLDPASVGSQLYRANVLRVILDKPVVVSFEEKKGLDFLIPLVARKFNFNIKLLDIAKSKYDPGRRGKNKVDESYNVYHKIIYLYEHGF